MSDGRLQTRGGTWWYEFIYAGQRIQESAKTASKTVAKEAERARRTGLELDINNIKDRRKERVKSLRALAEDYLTSYREEKRSPNFGVYAVGHLVRLLGDKMVLEITDKTVRDYQAARRKENAAGKSINEEVGFLLRIMKADGAKLRVTLKELNCLKLETNSEIGKAFSDEESAALLEAAAKNRSPYVLPALTIALNAGMRAGEIRQLRWSQVDFRKHVLTVGKGKTKKGEGRPIPLNGTLTAALQKHAEWFEKRFGGMRPEWYLFPFGSPKTLDPARAVTTLKTAWNNVRKNAKVTGRWHDTRHTLITELSESGAGTETIKEIAGHVSQAMLERYSHIRMEARRKALLDVEARRVKVEKKVAGKRSATKRLKALER